MIIQPSVHTKDSQKLCQKTFQYESSPLWCFHEIFAKILWKVKSLIFSPLVGRYDNVTACTYLLIHSNHHCLESSEHFSISIVGAWKAWGGSGHIWLLEWFIHNPMPSPLSHNPEIIKDDYICPPNNFTKKKYYLVTYECHLIHSQFGRMACYLQNLQDFKL